MNIFSRDYVVRKGSTFFEVILLEDIYVTLDPAKTYTVEGAIVLVADPDINLAISGALSENNTIITLTMSAVQTIAIEDFGNYNYAIDIASEDVVQTILEGSMLVKDDASKIT